MKNNWKLFYNPFTRIAGWQALGTGLVVVVLSGIIGTLGNLLFDGVLDAHLAEKADYRTSFILLAINVVSATVAMYAAAAVIAKQTRFIDIFGTMTFARSPYLLAALLALSVTPIPSEKIMENPLIILSHPAYLLFSLIAMPLMIWFIALMFNAFKVSTGAKGAKLVVAFIIGIIAAEIISKILIHFIFLTL